MRRKTVFRVKAGDRFCLDLTFVLRDLRRGKSPFPVPPVAAEHEITNGLGIIKAVGMMIAIGLYDFCNPSAPVQDQRLRQRYLSSFSLISAGISRETGQNAAFAMRATKAMINSESFFICAMLMLAMVS